MTDSSKRYDDKQVGLILRRATELATTGSPESTSRDGLSLVELEQIALEAGIDPALIRRAAEEVEGVGESGDHSWALGAPMTIRVRRVVEAEVPPELFDELLAEITLAGIGHGTAGLVGRTLSWQGTGGGQNPDSVLVTVVSRDGRTELQAERKRGQTAGALLGGLVGGGGGGIGFGMGVPLGLGLGSPLFAIMLPAAVVGGAYYAARKFFQSGHRKRRRELERLLDKLVERIAADGTPRISDSGSQPSLGPGSS